MRASMFSTINKQLNSCCFFYILDTHVDTYAAYTRTDARTPIHTHAGARGYAQEGLFMSTKTNNVCSDDKMCCV